MSDLEELLASAEGFEWDAANSDKNWLRHEVRQAEAEQTLLNTTLVVAASVKHTEAEARFVALGQSDAGRLLTVVFTVRGRRIRVISARAMSRAERKAYGQDEADPQTDS